MKLVAEGTDEPRNLRAIGFERTHHSQLSVSNFRQAGCFNARGIGALLFARAAKRVRKNRARNAYGHAVEVAKRGRWELGCAKPETVEEDRREKHEDRVHGIFVSGVSVGDVVDQWEKQKKRKSRNRGGPIFPPCQPDPGKREKRKSVSEISMMRKPPVSGLPLVSTGMYQAPVENVANFKRKKRTSSAGWVLMKRIASAFPALGCKQLRLPAENPRIPWGYRVGRPLPGTQPGVRYAGIVAKPELIAEAGAKWHKFVEDAIVTNAPWRAYHQERGQRYLPERALTS